MILCGGRGTRLQRSGRELPKPLVEIGDRPILWHVLQIYIAHGFGRFLLATGYRGNEIETFVATASWPAGVRIECVDTGLDTPTGGRLHRLRDRLAGAPFAATYADGLADLDLAAELDDHCAGGWLATMAVVRPRLAFGVTELDADGRVVGFHEKPRLESWVNGGFFCFDPGALDYLEDGSVLEREPLERLASDGRLHAFRHSGFWGCMDTYKDAVELNDLWAGEAPWRVWK